MAEVASKFQAGVEAMRSAAIARVNAWHRAKWNDQNFLSPAEVHQLLIDIVEDIWIATVQGT